MLISYWFDFWFNDSLGNNSVIMKCWFGSIIIIDTIQNYYFFKYIKYTITQLYSHKYSHSSGIYRAVQKSETTHHLFLVKSAINNKFFMLQEIFLRRLELMSLKGCVAGKKLLLKKENRQKIRTVANQSRPPNHWMCLGLFGLREAENATDYLG